MHEVIKKFLETKESVKKSFLKFHIGTENPEKKIPEIIVVSKTCGEERIVPLLEHGHRMFAENRVQEALSKWKILKEKYPDVELHLIGPLQTNKLKEALSIFDVIETLDREKLARMLFDEMNKGNKIPRLFVQVNTGEEPQKSGLLPKDVKAFLKLCIDELKLPVEGLMCIPPVDEPPALHFALLNKISKTYNRNPNTLLLSMGMSADYETAAAMGADYVRIGSAIFGERQ